MQQGFQIALWYAVFGVISCVLCRFPVLYSLNSYKGRSNVVNTRLKELNVDGTLEIVERIIDAQMF
jgi:hypothetical protein